MPCIARYLPSVKPTFPAPIKPALIPITFLHKEVIRQDTSAAICAVPRIQPSGESKK